MRKKNLIILTMFVVFGVGGFKSMGNVQATPTTKNSPSVVNGIELPPDPGALANKTKVGVDSNGNGVRDEVEIYLAQKYGQDKEKFRIIMEFARKKQAVLSLSLTDENDAKKYNFSADSAICLSKKLSINISKADRINYELSTQVFNNWERQAHFQDIMLKSDQLNSSQENPVCD